MLLQGWEWLLLPASGAGGHALATAVAWHGRLMVVAWSVAVPLAIIAARFFKVTPAQRWPDELDNKAWWHGHRALNYLAVAALLVSVVLVWGRNGYSGSLRDLHGWLGWTIVVTALLQVTGGLLRGSKGGPTAPRYDPDGRVLDLRGDHYDMTPRRILFERIHKSLGYLALLLGFMATLTGLRVADAPRWMWLALCLWWLALLAGAAWLQRSGRCLDTYQAIWGPDPVHPGNSLAPIGWGVHRATAGVSGGSDRPFTHPNGPVA